MVQRISQSSTKLVLQHLARSQESSICNRTIQTSKPSIRQFSTTPRTQRKGNRLRAEQLRHRDHFAPASPFAAKKQVQITSEKDVLKYRQDIGLLPMTWVPHTGEDRAKAIKMLFNGPRRWWKFYKYWISFKISYWYRTFKFRSDQFGLQLSRKNCKASVKTRPNRKEIESVAKSLHSKMFTALASVDKESIDKHCLQGLKSSMLQRLSSRRANELLQWSADYKHIKLANYRIQGDNLGTVGDKPVCLQQAVVRIESTQTLRRGTTNGAQLTETEREQWYKLNESPASVTWSEPVTSDKVEYFVLQRKLIKLEPQGQWKIWGFTHETTIDNFENTVIKGQDMDDYLKKKQEKKESVLSHVPVPVSIPGI